MAAFLVLFRRSLFVAVTSRKSLTTTSNCRLSYSQSLKRYSFDCRRRTLVNWMRYSSDAITWNDISSNELKLMLESKDIQLIDIREPIELIEDGRIESSVNIPLGELSEALLLTEEEFQDKYNAQKPSKYDSNIVFHCKSGVRSQTALNIAYQLGFSKARHYYPGYLGWEEFQNEQ